MAKNTANGEKTLPFSTTITDDEIKNTTDSSLTLIGGKKQYILPMAKKTTKMRNKQMAIKIIATATGRRRKKTAPTSANPHMAKKHYNRRIHLI